MFNKLLKNWYLFVPALLLLIGIADLDYSYYQVLRIAITIFAMISVFILKKYNKLVVAMVAIAILFNPIIPFYLNKGIWIILDIITAVIFIISGFKVIKNNNN